MSSPLATFRRLLGLTIPATSLGFFFHAMHVQLSAGRNIDQVLGSVGGGMDPELTEICESVRARIRKGASLRDSLRGHEASFPEIVPYILEVGELSGGLPEATQRLSDMFTQEVDAERKFRMGAFDPTLIFIASTIIVFLGTLFGSIGSITETGTPGAILVKDVIHTAISMLELVVIWFVARILLRHAFKWQPLRILVDTIKLALPGFGFVTRRLASARWVRSFATLWAAGVNISTSLEVASRTALNSYYERALKRAAVATRQGEGLAKSLSVDLLPRHMLAIIATSEVVGNLDKSLIQMAAEMEREALERAIIEMNRLVMLGWILMIIIQVVYHSAL